MRGGGAGRPRAPEGRPRPGERTPTTRKAEPGSGISASIREARRVADLTQSALATLVGVSPHTVWSWEAGRMTPSSERRMAIAFHCGTNVAALEGRPSSDRERIEEPVAAFRDAVAYLPDEDIKLIWTYIHFRRWRRCRRRRAA